MRSPAVPLESPADSAAPPPPPLPPPPSVSRPPALRRLSFLLRVKTSDRGIWKEGEEGDGHLSDNFFPAFSLLPPPSAANPEVEEGQSELPTTRKEIIEVEVELQSASAIVNFHSLKKKKL